MYIYEVIRDFRYTPGFQHYVAILVSVSVTVSVKTVSVLPFRMPLLMGRVRGNSAEFPAQKSGRSLRRVRTAGTEK